MAGEGTGGTADNQDTSIDNAAPKPAVINHETHTASPESGQQSQESRLEAIRQVFGDLPELRGNDDPFARETYEVAEFDASSQYIKINKNDAFFSLAAQTSSEVNPIVERFTRQNTIEYKRLEGNTTVRREASTDKDGKSHTEKVTYRSGEQFTEYAASGGISVAMGFGGHTAGEMAKFEFDTSGALTEIRISTKEIEDLSHAKRPDYTLGFGWRSSLGYVTEDAIIKGNSDWTKASIESDDIWEEPRAVTLNRPFFPFPGAHSQLLIADENGIIAATRLNTKSGDSVVAKLPKSIPYETAMNALSSEDPKVWTTAIKEAIPASITVNNPPAQ